MAIPRRRCTSRISNFLPGRSLFKATVGLAAVAVPRYRVSGESRLYAYRADRSIDGTRTRDAVPISGYGPGQGCVSRIEP